jgi:branched-chain amino acid transport system ATP-binding protein
MTVKENLLLGAYLRQNREAIADDLERVLSIFPRLKERLNQQAGTMSGGEQQMVAVGRALMRRPKMILIDEPSMGLAPNLVAEVYRTLRLVKQQGVTVFMVEQNVHMALGLADRAYILRQGELVMSGTAGELANDEGVRSAYLGGHGIARFG